MDVAGVHVHPHILVINPNQNAFHLKLSKDWPNFRSISARLGRYDKMRVVLHHGLYPAILHGHGPSSILSMVELGRVFHVTQIVDVKKTGSGLIFVRVCQSDARPSVCVLGLF